MKFIDGTNNKYSISEDGQVWSHYRNKIKVQQTSIHGYKTVGLYIDKKYHNRSIHRLVANAFIKNEDSSLALVNHIDGDKTNNQVSNLEWTNHSGNAKHAYNTGLMDNAVKMLIKRNTKVTESIKEQLTLRFKTTHKTLGEIAREFGLNESTVGFHLRDCKRSLKGKHIGVKSNNRNQDCNKIKLIKEQTMKSRTNKSIALEFNVGEHLVGRIKKGTAYIDCLEV